MSPAEKRNYHPADRLYVSSQGYTEKHVKNIAVRLAERHNATIPSYIYNQDGYANWITTNFRRDEIADVERLVRQSYSYGEKIYRKGRPIGSKNRTYNKGYDVSVTSWEDDIGPVVQASEAAKEALQQRARDMATQLAKEPQTPALRPPSSPTLDASLYALKSDVADVADQLNRSIREHNSSVGTAFNKLEHNVTISLTLLADKLNNIELSKPTIVTLERKELPAIKLGVQHRSFPLLLKVCNTVLRNGLRTIPWVYGPAGTGKSIGAEHVAKAMSLPFYAMGTTLVKFEVLGFINTSGYQSTPFRQAYEHGGVFCADEMDSWAKEATVALNNGLANGECAFPDKIVKRHKDFVMIAAANTVGQGATLDYVGRNKQDGATLNRFVYLNWPHDDALEDSLIANKDWLTYVRHVRQRVVSSGINPKPLVTMRASIFGEALLNNGIDRDTVIEMTLKQGLSSAQWDQIK